MPPTRRRLRSLSALALTALAACILGGQDIGRGAMTSDDMAGVMGGSMGVDGVGCVIPVSPCTGTTYVYVRADNLDGECNATLTNNADVTSIVNHGDGGGTFSCSNCAVGRNLKGGIGAAYLEFTGANSDEYSGTHDAVAQPYTMAVLAGTDTVSGFHLLMSGQLSNTQGSIYHSDATVATNTGATAAHGAHVAVAETYHRYSVYADDATGGTFCADGDCDALTTGTKDPGTTTWLGSNNGGGSLFMTGRGKVWLRCSGEQSTAIETFFDALPVAGPFEASTLVTVGDSITRGAYAGITTPWPTTVGGLSGLPVDNIAVSGDTLADMLVDVLADVVGDASYKIVSVYGGNNDIAARSSDDMIADFQDIADAVKADGKQLACMTSTPSYYIDSSAKEENADAYNAYVRANTECDFVVDTWALMEDDPYTLNAAYDWGDGLHINQDGLDLIGETFASAVYGVSAAPVRAGLAAPRAAARTRLAMGETP